MLNTQKISKAHYISSGVLSLHSIFDTIQGEGPFVGTPAIFVRLAGCNLQCKMCDTDYTTGAKDVSPNYILDAIDSLDHGQRLIVITGGEPFRQNIVPLVELLLDNGHPVQIETNGTLYLAKLEYSNPKLTIVCSPKTGKINKQLEDKIAAFKYVVTADDISEKDGLPRHALQHTATPYVARPPYSFRGDVFVQPIDVGNELENKTHLDAAIRTCMKYGYRLGLQVHKIINME